MRAFQDQFDGRRVADRLAGKRRRYDFWDEDRQMIEQASFFFIATSFGDFVDCSMRAGAPGFIHIPGPGTLGWGLFLKLGPGAIEYLMNGRSAYARFRAEWHKRRPKDKQY